MSLRRFSSAACVRMSVLALAFVGAAACQNWDLKRPEQAKSESEGGRSFTRLGGAAREPLTNDEAWRRLDAITEAQGEQRLELVDQFFDEFPVARRIARVHRLAGEAQLGLDRPREAADAFERAMALTRTDVLGLPLETELPLQLGMARIQAGQVDDGISWLVRTSLADHGPRVQQALHWAHAESGRDEPFAAWLSRQREPLLVQAPAFSLPGFQQERVVLAQTRGKATLINFWSPT